MLINRVPNNMSLTATYNADWHRRLKYYSHHRDPSDPMRPPKPVLIVPAGVAGGDTEAEICFDRQPFRVRPE
nr:hypothetical protein B0A51_16083 [Rachicladosporium sp. CCFEE 5018]